MINENELKLKIVDKPHGNVIFPLKIHY